ncbi:MAG: PDZ domain-containing protein [Verrucomicrobia bacterium]|nr:PDZ domain-containing protein [Verrucomicrobiota bacterium]
MTKTRRHAQLGTLVLTLAAIALAAAAPGTREASVEEDLRAVLGDVNVAGADHWIYNDLGKAVAEAKRANKPLFAVFRCVPGKVGAAFDDAVTRTNQTLVELARTHFVCVRVVDLKGVDLSQFQFDYDLSWAAMFLNADGTVYGRYGTQSAKGPEAYNNAASLERAMLRVMSLHAEYPTNAPSLAGKRGSAKPYKTALEMPGLEDKDLLRGPTTRENCLRCHAIHDAEHNEWQAKGPLNAELLWRYPLPEALGLTISAKDGSQLVGVRAASPAELAGLLPGDYLMRVHGQPMVSIADLQWVLHHLPNANQSVEVEFARAQHLATVKLQLLKGWKRTDFSWRASGWSLKPRLPLWAEELTDDEMVEYGLPSGTTAHRLTRIDTTTREGQAARDAGLRAGDIITGVAGKPFSFGPRDFQFYVRQNFRAGDKVPLSILRHGRPLKVELPLLP